MAARRPKRSAAEMALEAGPSYLDDLIAAGPREREAGISFVQRIAGIRAARKCWFKTAAETGSVEETCKVLGVNRSNLYNYLGAVGLRIVDIRAHIAKTLAEAPEEITTAKDAVDNSDETLA